MRIFDRIEAAIDKTNRNKWMNRRPSVIEYNAYYYTNDFDGVFDDKHHIVADNEFSGMRNRIIDMLLYEANIKHSPIVDIDIMFRNSGIVIDSLTYEWNENKGRYDEYTKEE